MSLSSWIQRFVRELFGARVWQASYLWPNLYPLVLCWALSTGFSPAHLSPLLLWCPYSRQPSPFPPAFTLPSRRRQTFLASYKTDPGLLWSSSQPCSAPVRVWIYFLITGGQSCIWCVAIAHHSLPNYCILNLPCVFQGCTYLITCAVHCLSFLSLKCI